MSVYKNILLAFQASTTDASTVEQVKSLANQSQGHVILLSIDNPTARADCRYLAQLRQMTREFRSAGISARLKLKCGDPAGEIEKQVRLQNFDLVAVVTRKCRSLADFVFASEVSRIRGSIKPPVLLFPMDELPGKTRPSAAAQLHATDRDGSISQNPMTARKTYNLRICEAVSYMKGSHRKSVARRNKEDRNNEEVVALC